MNAKEKDMVVKAGWGGGIGAMLGSWLALNNMVGALSSHPVIATGVFAAFFAAGSTLVKDRLFD